MMGKKLREWIVICRAELDETLTNLESHTRDGRMPQDSLVAVAYWARQLSDALTKAGDLGAILLAADTVGDVRFDGEPFGTK